MTCNELFNLVHFALFSFDKIKDLESQKILLIKFFLLLGFYPEEDECIKFFYNIITIPIDRITDAAIDLKSEKKKLNLWILKCINMNPYSKLFKTKNYLNKILI